MKKITLAVLLLSGCINETSKDVNPGCIDQCIRRDEFNKCLQGLPNGPDKTVGNDWSEVVDSCNDASRTSSWRLDCNIVKPECRG